MTRLNTAFALPVSNYARAHCKHSNEGVHVMKMAPYSKQRYAFAGLIAYYLISKCDRSTLSFLPTRQAFRVTKLKVMNRRNSSAFLHLGRGPSTLKATELFLNFRATMWRSNGCSQAAQRGVLAFMAFINAEIEGENF